MTVLFELRQATRPEQTEPEPVAAYAEFAPAQDHGREIVRRAEETDEGPNYAEVRWYGRLMWCAWVRPKNLVSVADLFNEDIPKWR